MGMTLFQAPIVGLLAIDTDFAVGDSATIPIFDTFEFPQIKEGQTARMKQKPNTNP